MTSRQRYERILGTAEHDTDNSNSSHGLSRGNHHGAAGNDDDENGIGFSHPHKPTPIPASPPPSFHSRDSSPGRPTPRDYADSTLTDAFDDGSENEGDEATASRRRLIGSERSASPRGRNPSDRPTVAMERRTTQLPVFPIANVAATTPMTGANTPRRVVGGGTGNDGVFANLSAKPGTGEEMDEKPPSYEQAAADATPPYWETTILAPGGLGTGDEVFVDGLPVGSIFSFAWNTLISVSFGIVGFLLTYLLHTTHAAKNGSRAGLGISLVQYGFTMKGAPSPFPGGGPDTNPDPGYDQDGQGFAPIPPDPNAHDFSDQAVAAVAAAAAVQDGSGVNTASSGGGGGILPSSEWIAYALMIVGWFVLIRAVSDFLRARRHEQLVLQSPDRGLSVPIVSDTERPETAV